MTVKQPQDRKKKVGDFTYTFGENTVTLPSLNSLMTFGFSRTHRHLPPDEQVYILLEENCGEETLATLDLMDGDDTKAFVEGWQEHSGIDAGESEAS